MIFSMVSSEVLLADPKDVLDDGFEGVLASGRRGVLLHLQCLLD